METEINMFHRYTVENIHVRINGQDYRLQRIALPEGGYEMGDLRVWKHTKGSLGQSEGKWELYNDVHLKKYIVDNLET